MSFKDCILQKVQDKEITKKDSDYLLGKYERLIRENTESLGDGAAAVKATEDLLNLEASKLAHNKSKRIGHASHVKRVLEDFEESGVDLPKFTQNLFENTAWRQRTLQRMMEQQLVDFIEKFRTRFLGTKGVDFDQDVVRHLYGQEVLSPQARVYGDAVRNVLEQLKEMYIAAGGRIEGDLTNYFPQMHVKRRMLADIPTTETVKGGPIRKAKDIVFHKDYTEAGIRMGFEKWYSYIRPRLDLEQMIDWTTGIPFTEKRLLEEAWIDYESIITDGLSVKKRMLNEGRSILGYGLDISSRRMNSRFYRFKDADAFIEYNAKYGAGEDGLYDMVINHIRSFTRDIGTLQVMGPNPNALNRHMQNMMLVKGHKNLVRGHVDAQYKVVSGFSSGVSEESNWYNWFSVWQNIMRMRLGSASVAAISDTPLLAIGAKLNGLAPANTLKRYFKLLSSAKDREQARQTLALSEVAGGTAAMDTRYAGETYAGAAGTRGAGMINRFSGLNAMTAQAQNSIQGEFQATMANMLRAFKDYASIDKGYQGITDLLDSVGFTARDWEILQSVPLYKDPMHGGKFFREQDIFNAKVGSEAEILQTSLRLGDAVSFLRGFVTNEPTVKTRALTTGGYQHGDFGRAIVSSVTMFKSFPITVTFNHVLPAVKSASEGLRLMKELRPGEALPKFGHLGAIFIGTTMFGAISLTAKDIISGKTPRDPSDPKFWMAASLQGGGLGLYGDFLFKEHGRFGRDPIVDILGGPLIGTLGDISKLTLGNLQKATFDLAEDGTLDNNTFARDLVEFSKRNMPFGNLWYGRLALERLIFDQLENFADPNYDRRRRRHENKLKNEFNQGYWWRKGDALPSGL